MTASEVPVLTGSGATSRAVRTAALPLLFIVMWSSGYVAGKLGLPYAGPFTLIFIRFSTAALILLTVALVTRAPWPKTWAAAGHIAVVGVLIQATQFSCLYSGMKLGVTAGVSALIVGTMPLFTALGAGWFLGETVTARQWLGSFIGLTGVFLVVSQKIEFGHGRPLGYLAVAGALLGITSGTLYQKKYCGGMDLRTGGFIQLSVASTITFVLALSCESLRVTWTPAFVLSSAWLSVINSIGAISLLFIMIRRGEASRVAHLFHLIPSVTAVMGFLLLSETLKPVIVLGFVVTASGVYLATRKGRVAAKATAGAPKLTHAVIAQPRATETDIRRAT